MRKFVIASIAALAATGFVATQAVADCSGSHKTAMTPMPTKTADSSKTAPETAAPTKTEKGS